VIDVAVDFAIRADFDVQMRGEYVAHSPSGFADDAGNVRVNVVPVTPTAGGEKAAKRTKNVGEVFGVSVLTVIRAARYRNAIPSLIVVSVFGPDDPAERAQFCPRGSFQNRPMKVTSKPANGRRAGQRCFYSFAGM
jgi:hypothetical protein